MTINEESGELSGVVFNHDQHWPFNLTASIATRLVRCTQIVEVWTLCQPKSAGPIAGVGPGEWRLIGLVKIPLVNWRGCLVPLDPAVLLGTSHAQVRGGIATHLSTLVYVEWMHRRTQ